MRDLYRVSYTISETYMHAPIARDEMLTKLVSWLGPL